MKIVRVVLVAAVAVVLSPIGARATHPEDSQRYTFGPGDVIVLGCGTDNQGGSCFPLDGDEATASIVIDDDTDLETGAYYSFRDGSNAELAGGGFCASKDGLAVPAGAVQLVVFVDGPIFGPQDCLLSDGSPGIGTEGTITVNWGYPAP